MLCNTDLLLPDLFHITFALDRFELEGRKLRKRLGAVVYTALPKPQVTALFSTTEPGRYARLPPLGSKRPQLYAHTAPRGPFGQEGQSQLREAQKRSENIPSNKSTAL